MIIQLNDFSITDNSNQQATYFLKTAQNKKYLSSVLLPVLTVDEAKKLLNINENIKIIGITGTNGKTTTASAIASMLQNLKKKVALLGTRGFFIDDLEVSPKGLTTPPSLQILHFLHIATQQKCDYFVMEVSSHAIFQKRIEGLKFAMKIFTNLSQDHLDFHKNFENYADTKSSFFQDECLKIINSDDENIKFNPKNAYTYGKNGDFRFCKCDLSENIKATINFHDKSYSFSSKLRGFFNLYNLTAAIACVKLLENVDEFDTLLQHFNGVSGRMEVVAKNVIVDFAHTPDGIEKVLSSMHSDNIVVLFGAGGDRDKTKRPLMAQMACKYAKKIYITSDNPRSEDPDSIINDIKAGLSKNAFIEADRKKAIKKALNELENDEVLLILGKGDETYQEINGVKYPFDDRQVVREFLKLK